MNRYITAEAEEDIKTYLAEWETGRYGKKLTWAIVAKAFTYSRQALSGNTNIKDAFDKAKKVLREADTQVDNFKDLEKENQHLKKELERLAKENHAYQQKYLRWQINAQLRGISVAALSKPINPSIKEELRKLSEEDQG
ncbi:MULTISPECIES: hypothetical protein [Vibrio]|uniref:Uncharacterized protein n=1 Tax=Vibrio splendidus TaxID=29497 RepID=A0A2N7JNB1_VIBSP|nr:MULTISPECIES: hypothetical protein [Vibrio]MDN3632569.1 hypothetical protein [Vibrio lentus]PMM43581.1 hypothetical protein BCT54_06260 [Vibrio splendidus]